MRKILLVSAFALAALPAVAQTPHSVYDLGDLHNDLAALGVKLDTLHNDMGKIGIAVPVVVAPAGPVNWELADHLPAKAGDTVMVPAGTELTPVHIPVPATIQGAGMRSSLADGRGGVDAGHRLAWGKGFYHVGDAGTVIADMGFLESGRDRGGKSDGETSVYAEAFGTLGTITYLRDAFDGQENGVFTPTAHKGDGPGANVDVIIDHSVFGRLAANGENDGSSHDIYSNGHSLTVRGSVFVGNSRGNTIKSRAPRVDVSGSYVARSNGRWIDLPAHTAFTSIGNTYVQRDDAGSNNAIGVFDENDNNEGTAASSFLSTGDTFCLAGTRNPVIWNNDPALTMQFVNPVLHWAGAAGANPPQFNIQGQVSGLRTLTEADRVDACPDAPSDPTK